MSIHLNRINLKGKDVTSKWHLIDADGKILGRLASEIARLLIGKDKPTYSRNLLSGDFVVVINSQGIRLTGNKSETKKYWRHSGYPGGMSEISFKVMKEKDQQFIIKNAVKGMLPKNKQGNKILSRLKVYGGNDHPHESQIIASNKGLNIIYDQNVGNLNSTQKLKDQNNISRKSKKKTQKDKNSE
ncbi:MAG: 50S ribosomal protein L13 [Chloroflexi bacterium]|nr:50S ribosomal protein L13 [Chloroflexota bacterium]|tara:strand:- start:2881 stop:3438 length:558 start_codon:yes stop_codon:yes gene_type:complete